MSKIYITYWKAKIKKFKIEIRLFEIKYLKTKTKTPNLGIYMKLSLKIGLISFFFCKVIVRWKWKLRNNIGVLEHLKGNWREKQEKEKRKKRREETEKEKKRKTNFFPNWKKS